MTESEKKIKQVCKCEKCGNEAEMVVTCSLPGPGARNTGEKTPVERLSEKGRRVKGTATCTHCGNEADMWVDLDV